MNVAAFFLEKKKGKVDWWCKYYRLKTPKKAISAGDLKLNLKAT